MASTLRPPLHVRQAVAPRCRRRPHHDRTLRTRPSRHPGAPPCLAHNVPMRAEGAPVVVGVVDGHAAAHGRHDVARVGEPVPDLARVACVAAPRVGLAVVVAVVHGQAAAPGRPQDHAVVALTQQAPTRAGRVGAGVCGAAGASPTLEALGGDEPHWVREPPAWATKVGTTGDATGVNARPRHWHSPLNGASASRLGSRGLRVASLLSLALMSSTSWMPVLACCSWRA